MKKIEDTFENIIINKSIYVNETYKLPSEIILKIDGSNVNGEIRWDSSKIITSKEGVFMYCGRIPQYGRRVLCVGDVFMGF